MQHPLFAAGVGQFIVIIIVLVFYVVKALLDVSAKKRNDNATSRQEPEPERPVQYKRKRPRWTKQEPVLTIEDDIEGPTKMLAGSISSSIKTAMPSDSASAGTYVQSDGIGNFSYDTIDHNAAYDEVNPAIATAFANEVVQLLNSPSSVRQAVIMSEILNKPLGLERRS
jgi:hypothetical protein